MLYQHIKQKDGEESFTEHMIGGLLAGIQNDDSCTFLKTEPRFLEIVNKYNFLKRIDINVTWNLILIAGGVWIGIYNK